MHVIMLTFMPQVLDFPCDCMPLLKTSLYKGVTTLNFNLKHRPHLLQMLHSLPTILTVSLSFQVLTGVSSKHSVE